MVLCASYPLTHASRNHKMMLRTTRNCVSYPQKVPPVPIKIMLRTPKKCFLYI